MTERVSELEKRVPDLTFYPSEENPEDWVMTEKQANYLLNDAVAVKIKLMGFDEQMLGYDHITFNGILDWTHYDEGEYATFKIGEDTYAVDFMDNVIHLIENEVQTDVPTSLNVNINSIDVSSLTSTTLSLGDTLTLPKDAIKFTMTKQALSNPDWETVTYTDLYDIFTEYSKDDNFTQVDILKSRDVTVLTPIIYSTPQNLASTPFACIHKFYHSSQNADWTILITKTDAWDSYSDYDVVVIGYTNKNK